MSLGLLLLNAAYVAYTASAIFKEMLKLRIVLLVATILFIAYGAVEPNVSVLLWNLPVLFLHSYAIFRYLKERREVDLDDEAEAIHTLLFGDLDRPSFNALWHCGEERTVHDEVLIEAGTTVDELSLLLDGEVTVVVNDETSLRMGHFRLIGEISTLRESNATATVTANGTVRLRAWAKDALDICGNQHPQVQLALLKLMGQEAARKLN